MIAGIGVDLCSISRIEGILNREGPDGPFFRRVFTPAEQAEAEHRHNKAEYYAARFAVSWKACITKTAALTSACTAPFQNFSRKPEYRPFTFPSQPKATALSLS